MQLRKVSDDLVAAAQLAYCFQIPGLQLQRSPRLYGGLTRSSQGRLQPAGGHIAILETEALRQRGITDGALRSDRKIGRPTRGQACEFLSGAADQLAPFRRCRAEPEAAAQHHLAPRQEQ